MRDRRNNLNITKKTSGFFSQTNFPLPEICCYWHNHINNTVNINNADMLSKIDLYNKYFKLYYSSTGLILDIETENFFSYDCNHLLTNPLNEQIEKDIPFIKPCYLAEQKLTKFHMYFWSPDALNFYLLEEKLGGWFISKHGKDKKEVHFSTTENSDDKVINCLIKFTASKAILLEPQIIEKKVNNVITDEIFEFHWEEGMPNDISPPKPKNLLSFQRCNTKCEELLLQLIFTNKIHMIPFQYVLTPVYGLQRNDNDKNYSRPTPLDYLFEKSSIKYVIK